MGIPSILKSFVLYFCNRSSNSDGEIFLDVNDKKLLELARVLRNDKGQVLEKAVGYVKVRKYDTTIKARVVNSCDLEITIQTQRAKYKTIIPYGFRRILESVRNTTVFVDPEREAWVFISQRWDGALVTNTVSLNHVKTVTAEDGRVFYETDSRDFKRALRMSTPSFQNTGIIEDLLGQRALRCLALLR